MAEKKNLGGRPTKYKEEYCEQAEKLCKLGAIDSEIADFFGIAESTLNNWKEERPQFMESIKRGKLIADAEVADKLFQRATGYAHVDTKFATHEGKITDTVEYTKHYAPDPTAAIFWLKNRQSSKWMDKQHNETTVKVTKADDNEW